jgi:hypothetical protein
MITEKTIRQVKEIKQSFRLLMNGDASRQMRESGLGYHLNWGVSLNDLKAMASQYPKDEQLAIELWKENIRECKITLTGEDIAFIEFGSGIVYNGSGSPHPMGEKLGMTIGSYGYHQGKRGYWYYEDENGQRTLSIGTKAAMPMYKAEIEMLKKINKVAREVYG